MAGDRRKTFVAREDLLIGVSSIAKESGKSLYETINEVLEIAILFNRLGISPRSALEECRKLKAARDAGYTLCLENLWLEINEIAYRSSPEDALAAWRDAGFWLAKRHMTGANCDRLASIKADLEYVLWNASEFSISTSQNGGALVVKLMGPQFSKAHSKLLLAFFEGLAGAMGFEPVEKEAFSGGLRLQGIKISDGKGDGGEKGDGNHNGKGIVGRASSEGIG